MLLKSWKFDKQEITVQLLYIGFLCISTSLKVKLKPTTRSTNFCKFEETLIIMLVQ